MGKLYVVSTPIGNLGDITLRAIEILSSVDLVACEDTRETRKLLTHHGIRAKTTSFHEHNKEKKTPGIVRRILSGEDCAIVSDRGTPAVSDPGFYLVRAAIEKDIEVVPIPYEHVIPLGGALHCTTLDVYREGTCEDYFPKQIPNY